ncbi:MAG: hypothetical protein WKG07_21710 [Hymenobacter sp.]
MLRILFFWASFLGLAAPALAQREYTNWCFGYDTIPDPTTQLTFYTRFGHGAQVKFNAAGPQTVGLCRASNNSIADAQGNFAVLHQRRQYLRPAAPIDAGRRGPSRCHGRLLRLGCPHRGLAQ